MRITRGSIHQGYPYFRAIFAGQQCTAIAYVALLFLTIRARVNFQFGQDDINEIVTTGSTLFENISYDLGRIRNPINLLHSEVNGRFVNDQLPTLQLILNRYYGVVGQSGNAASGSWDFNQALQEGFATSSGMLVTFGSQTIALYYNEQSHMYYVFDSHARSEIGLVHANGYSMLAEFDSLRELYLYLQHLYHGLEFDISLVNHASSNSLRNTRSNKTNLSKDRNMYTSTIPPNQSQPTGNGGVYMQNISNNFDSHVCCNNQNKNSSDHSFQDFFSFDNSFSVTHQAFTSAMNILVPEYENISDTCDQQMSDVNCCEQPSDVKKHIFTVLNHTYASSKNSLLNHTYASSLTFSNNSLLNHTYAQVDKEYEHDEIDADIVKATVCYQETQNYTCDHTYACIGHNKTKFIESVQCQVQIDFCVGSMETQTQEIKHEINECIYTATPIDSEIDECIYTATPIDSDLNLHCGSLNESQVCDSHIADTGNKNLNQKQSSSKVQNKKDNNIHVVYKPKEPKNCMSKEYQKFIEELPSYSCKSCERFMFKNQISSCKRNFPKANIRINDLLCSTCLTSVYKNQVPNLSVYGNNMDTGIVPQVLKNLNFLEKRLIARVSTFFSLVLLPGFPIGQFGQKGYVINFPVDIYKICDQLSAFPFRSCDSQYYLVSCSCHEKLTTPKLMKVSKVFKALTWLKLHNNHYRQINIPPDSNVIYDSSDGDNTVETDFIEMGTCPADFNVPGNVIDLNAAQPIDMHKINCEEELAFPWLFPYGINGFSTERGKKLTLGQYYKSRFYNIDSRWRQNITYLLSAVNSFEKNVLSQVISVYTRIRKSASANSEPLRASNVTDGSNPDLLENSYMFMKKIRGTVAYWKTTLFNLLAMIKNLGPPTLFMTLSSNDYHWEELALTLQKKDRQSIDKHALPKNVQSNPLLTAIHFERRWRALLKNVIKGPNRPLGNVVDYFARIEFQTRGSPHMHVFLWIENAPNLLTATTSQEIISYIDNVISTTIPSADEQPTLHKLVTSLQTHSHRKYCKRQNRCRFHFPYPPCSNTRLITNIDTVPLNNKKFYETKRTAKDSMVNAFNPLILLHWRANMDIQMIGGPYGVAYYVCSYICKSEPDTLKIALSNVISQISEISPPLSQRARMFRIGMCVLKHRTMSAQEAAYRIGGLQLIWSSRETITLHALPPNRQFKKLKPATERQHLPGDCEDIFEKNIIDHYYDRPDILDQISLFRFCQCFKVSKIKNKSRSCMLTLNKLYEITSRRNKAVIRIITAPRNTEDYYYSLLMLYLPHRSLSEIVYPYNSVIDAFIHKNVNFDNEALQSCNGVPTIEDAIHVVRLSQIEQNVPFELSINETEGIEILVDSFEESPTDNSFSKDLESNSNCQQFDVASINNSTNMCEDIEWQTVSVCQQTNSLYEQALKLTNDQKIVLNYIQSCFKEKKYPFHIFITGGAGVGKSYLINILVDWLRLSTSKFSGNDPVCICAPTGVAAFHVKGRTLHSVFKIPVLHRNNQEYKLKEISSHSLPQLRRLFKCIHTLIIDEISMVSADMLESIHYRLTVIKQNETPFGGLNVITVGDFYQLRPVKSNYAFKSTSLWHLFKPFFLRQNMRQIEDSTYANLLNRVRIGLLNEDDITSLQQRVVSENNIPNNILHIYPTIKQVQMHNDAVQNLLPSKCHIIFAKHRFSENDINPEEIFDEQLIPSDDRDAGGLPLCLKLSVGTKVMLLRNLNVEYGLVNGASGFVTHVELDENLQYSIKVSFEDVCIPQCQLNSNMSIDIPLYSQEFLVNGRLVLRENFPLTPCWATTIHKVQGLSLNSAAIYIGNELFAKGQGYVALSRVTKLNQLYLLAFNPTKLQANATVTAEYLRLEFLANHHNHDNERN